MKKISTLGQLKRKAVSMASAINLKNNPKCVLCNQPSRVSHHFIRQSRSNFLRCDMRNLIPLCNSCHLRLHSGYETVTALQLTKIYGKDWSDGLLRDSTVTIQDNKGHWRGIIKELEEL